MELMSGKTIWLLAFGDFEPHTRVQRLPVPHTFNNGLSLREAAAAVWQVALRIIMSCLLFAVWGAFTIRTWFAVGDHFWRWPVMAFAVALFACSFLLLMITISQLLRLAGVRR